MEQAPKARDPTELPGGGRLGNFWHRCKARRLCGRVPYDQLLTIPVLRADYRKKGRSDAARAAAATADRRVRAQTPVSLAAAQ